ncbi:MAG: hypothetical protein ACHQNE_10255, partial [Candidatus Kapaibacterium sp.]
SPQALFAERLNRNIKSMTAGEDSESAVFNTRISALNAAAPLDPKHLDSADVAANVALVLDFTNYLKHERQWSDSLTHSFTDSMYILSEDRPPDLKVLDAADIEISFRLERGAFDTFLDAMNKVYADVLDVLLFLQHTHYTIAKKASSAMLRPVFDTRADVKEYIRLTAAVDSDSKTLNKANQDLRAANAKANTLTQKRQSSWTQ